MPSWIGLGVTVLLGVDEVLVMVEDWVEAEVLVEVEDWVVVDD
jgi:hypothetical protein